jgi:hypothetical protein
MLYDDNQRLPDTLEEVLLLFYGQLYANELLQPQGDTLCLLI